MTSAHQNASLGQGFPYRAAALDRRSDPRRLRLWLGVALARGRRTVTRWIRAAGLSRQYQPCSTTVAAAGKQADTRAARLVYEVVKTLVADQTRLTLALDDTPTPRYGPYVQGAGIHHNPTPGPAGAPHLDGPLGVVLGLLAVPPAWGVIARPLLCRLDVRKKDLPRIVPKHRPEVRTQLAMGVALLRLARAWLRPLGTPCWAVVDGASAKAPFLMPAMSLGRTIVSRLRTDAALWRVPGPRTPGRRGRPRIDSESRIELAKRAGQRRGWATGILELYGKGAKKRSKTFVATWRPAGEAIRVVPVDQPSGWVAFVCTAVEASAAEILATVADRFSLETACRDCQEIVGAGQQQVRFVWATIGAFHICLGRFTMTEAWAWVRSEVELVDRGASPWDDPDRRPSHADKRRAWRGDLLAEAIRAVRRPGVSDEESRAVAERLLNLAA